MRYSWSLSGMFVRGSTLSDIWRKVITFDINTKAGLRIKNTRGEELIWNGCRQAGTLHPHIPMCDLVQSDLCHVHVSTLSVCLNQYFPTALLILQAVILGSAVTEAQMLLKWGPSCLAMSLQNKRVEGLSSCPPHLQSSKTVICYQHQERVAMTLVPGQGGSETCTDQISQHALRVITQSNHAVPSKR